MNITTLEFERNSLSTIVIPIDLPGTYLIKIDGYLNKNCLSTLCEMLKFVPATINGKYNINNFVINGYLSLLSDMLANATSSTNIKYIETATINKLDEQYIEFLKIPSIKKIPNNFMRNCYNLKSLILPDDGSLEEIGDFAFENCYALTSIIIPKSCTKVGMCAFQHCVAAKIIDSLVLSSGNLAFDEKPDKLFCEYIVHSEENKSNIYLLFSSSNMLKALAPTDYRKKHIINIVGQDTYNKIVLPNSGNIDLTQLTGNSITLLKNSDTIDALVTEALPNENEDGNENGTEWHKDGLSIALSSDLSYSLNFTSYWWTHPYGGLENWRTQWGDKISKVWSVFWDTLSTGSKLADSVELSIQNDSLDAGVLKGNFKKMAKTLNSLYNNSKAKDKLIKKFTDETFNKFAIGNIYAISEAIDFNHINFSTNTIVALVDSIKDKSAEEIKDDLTLVKKYTTKSKSLVNAVINLVGNAGSINSYYEIEKNDLMQEIDLRTHSIIKLVRDSDKNLEGAAAKAYHCYAGTGKEYNSCWSNIKATGSDALNTIKNLFCDIGNTGNSAKACGSHFAAAATLGLAATFNGAILTCGIAEIHAFTGDEFTTAISLKLNKFTGEIILLLLDIAKDVDSISPIIIPDRIATFLDGTGTYDLVGTTYKHHLKYFDETWPGPYCKTDGLLHIKECDSDKIMLEAGNIKAELDELNKQLLDLTTDVEDYTELVDQLKNNLALVKTNYEDAQTKIEENKASIEDHEEEYKYYEKLIQQYKNEYDVASTRREACISEIKNFLALYNGATTQSEYNGLKDTFLGLLFDGDFNSDLAEYKENLTKLKNYESEMQDRIDSIEACYVDYEYYKSSMQELEDENEILEKIKDDNNEGIINEVQTALTNAQTKLKDANEKLNKFNEENSSKFIELNKKYHETGITDIQSIKEIHASTIHHTLEEFNIDRLNELRKTINQYGFSTKDPEVKNTYMNMEKLFNEIANNKNVTFDECENAIYKSFMNSYKNDKFTKCPDSWTLTDCHYDTDDGEDCVCEEYYNDSNLHKQEIESRIDKLKNNL